MSIYQFVSCHTLNDDRRFYFCVHFDSLPFLWRWNSLPLNVLVLLSMVCFRFRFRLLFLSLHFLCVCVCFVIVRCFSYHRTTTNLLQFIFVYSFWSFVDCHHFICCLLVVLCVKLRNACSTLWRYRVSCDNIFCFLRYFCLWTKRS